MADIRITKSNRGRSIVFTGNTPEGVAWLKKNMGGDPAIRGIEHAEDVIAHLHHEGFTIEE